MLVGKGNRKYMKKVSGSECNIDRIPNPHGGALVDQFVETKKLTDDMHFVDIDDNLRNDIENIAYGIFSPLNGFIGNEDFENILTFGRLKNGLPWTIPIILDVDKHTAVKCKEYGEISLRYNNEHFAILYFDEYYKYDKLRLAKSLYLTTDDRHPGVSRTFKLKDTLVSGKIEVSKKRVMQSQLESYRLAPSATRKEIYNRKWNTVVGFQTRNIPHIAHEMLQKAALNIYDGLFINPLIGKKKKGDFRDEVIFESYMKLIENYYPKNRVMFVTLHTEMRYAGPKEAIHHAIMRKNFGCSHFIVGRDHAGVGDYYQPFAAHEIFNEFPDIGIHPIFFPTFYYCKKCLGYANERTCPHEFDFREELSGTRMRKMVTEGDLPRKHLLRPEIAEVITKFQDPFVK